MSGTIRGKKVRCLCGWPCVALCRRRPPQLTRRPPLFPQNAVRAVLGTFTQSSKFESELLEQLYNEEKNNTIVLYITSVAAVRQRFDECNTMLKVSCMPLNKPGARACATLQFSNARHFYPIFV